MSANNTLNSNREHREIWELLPWYINQSLNDTEQTRVKKHIATCVTCRIELKQQQQVYENIQQTDLLQQMSNASFTQLKKRIDIHPVSKSASYRRRLVDFIKFPFQFSGFTKQFSAIAAATLLITTAFMFNTALVTTQLGNEYRTLAQPAESLQESAKPDLIRVVFADETELAQIDAIIKSVSGHLINGPYENGVYEIQIAGDDGQNRFIKTTEAISALRHNSNVIFAELAHVSFSPE